MTRHATAAHFQFRIVIPTADGMQVAGEFPTRLYALMFQQVILTERSLKCEVEEFINGQWWADQMV